MLMTWQIKKSSAHIVKCLSWVSKSEISYTSVRFCETKQEKNGYLIPFNLIKTDEHETGLSLLDQKSFEWSTQELHWFP